MAAGVAVNFGQQATRTRHIKVCVYVSAVTNHGNKTQTIPQWRCKRIYMEMTIVLDIHGEASLRCDYD